MRAPARWIRGLRCYPDVRLWEVCRPDLVTPVIRRSRKPLGRIVAYARKCQLVSTPEIPAWRRCFAAGFPHAAELRADAPAARRRAADPAHRRPSEAN